MLGASFAAHVAAPHRALSTEHSSRSAVRIGRVNKLLALTLLLLTACATAPSDLATPAWTAVPSAAVESLCRRLKEDGVGTEGSLVLVRTTQPIASGQAMSALARASYKRADAPGASQALLAAGNSMPVEHAGSTCTWLVADRVDPQRHVDRMVVELSPPVANPYSRNEAGLFARVSLGGTHPTWYWIPLGQRAGQWLIGRTMPLSM